jgi:hypothetical protein
MKETYDDLAILEYYEYRCAYCLDLLPVWGSPWARKHGGDVYKQGTRNGDHFYALFGENGVSHIYHGFHWDHVTPRSQGGETSWGNIVPACAVCNQTKYTHTPIEWLLAKGGFVSTAMRNELTEKWNKNKLYTICDQLEYRLQIEDR